MRVLLLLLCTLFALLPSACAQTSRERSEADKTRTIEGYWQDMARRITFAREAPPAYVYGGWTNLDPEQTYPSAKQIRKSGGAYELVDLLYDDDYAINIVRARENGIEFVRTMKSSACAIHHSCRLDGDELYCALENICQEKGQPVLDWRSEERYARRNTCERDGGRQAQGIPVRCR
jgi:hypothetical protein